MPPSPRITREQIIASALDLVREEGPAGLNARRLAARLNCSTQPIFSNFATMEVLRAQVMAAASDLYHRRVDRETASGKYPPYKASGMAYILFAREEPELFRLLYMTGRDQQAVAGEDAFNRYIDGLVTEATGLPADRIRRFHLEMWVAVHGIASMLATGFLELDTQLIESMVSDIYWGLRKQYGRE